MQDAPVDAPPPPPVTVIEVVYPPGRGAIGLRGSQEPLSWESTTEPTEVRGDRSVFRLAIPPDAILEMKVVRNDDEAWANGRNFVVHAGDNLVCEPYFDRQEAELVTGQQIDDDLLFDVLLPPGYEEQEHKRYAVLYMLDGQSLWSTSEDPFGVWSVEQSVGSLFELDVVDEMIVVGIHTADRRMERLTPVPDETHGGGEGEQFLDRIVSALKPHIDDRFRTQPGRESTGIMGSSLGGLFAFFAGMRRPDVFGKVACLSSSFWWANRWAVRWAQAGNVPTERPVLYLDSGAALSVLEQDASVKDGFHHTRSMFRALTAAGYDSGVDLHRMVFTGARHEAASWAARVGIPLQLLFPAEVHVPRTLRRHT